MLFIKNHFFPILVLMSGLVISLILFFIFYDIALNRITREDVLEKRNFVETINQNWRILSSNILSLANFYETTSFVSKDEFLALSSYISGDSSVIKSIGWWQLAMDHKSIRVNQGMSLVYQFPDGDNIRLIKEDSVIVENYLQSYAIETKTLNKIHINTIISKDDNDLIVSVVVAVKNEQNFLLGVLLYRINITKLVANTYQGDISSGLGYRLFTASAQKSREMAYQEIISSKIGLKFLTRRQNLQPIDLISAWIILLLGILFSIFLCALIIFNIAKYRKIKESTQNKAESFDAEVRKKEFIQKRLEVYQNFLKKLVDEKTSELQLANKHLKANQNKLIESEKMVSLGLMAAGITHEINNPLGFIKSNNQTLEEIFSPIKKILILLDEYVGALESESKDAQKIESVSIKIINIVAALNINEVIEDIDGALDETADGISRIQDIISGLREFLYQGNDAMIEANIREIIEQSIKVASVAFKQKEIKITTSYDYSGVLECHPNRISQVIINILNNSCDSFGMSNLGMIKIKVYQKEKKIYIVIGDNGEGMSDDTLKNITTPFYTTKGVGSGLGLGMYVSYIIIERHKGKIIIDSKKDVGTIFTIELPIIQEKNHE